MKSNKKRWGDFLDLVDFLRVEYGNDFLVLDPTSGKMGRAF
jgi:hypothetical protein